MDVWGEDLDVQGEGGQTSVGCLKSGKGGIFNFFYVGIGHTRMTHKNTVTK